MHPEEVVVDEAGVRRLLRSQLPQWADLPLLLIDHAGTDHVVYRLGRELSVRLPRVGWAAAQPEQDHVLLPRLAPHLPVPISTPVALGDPDEHYPFPWAVHRWLPGQQACRSGPGLARDIAAFVCALQGIDTEGSWPSTRGGPLDARDEQARSDIADLADLLDAASVLRVWDRALAAPAWAGEPVWVHGDLTEGNLLVDGDRLVGVIDFGPTGVGDPAIDLLPAWAVLDDRDRAVFRQASGCDDATWERGRGWALAVGLAAWPYYRRTNPGIVARSERMIHAVLTT